MSEYSPARSKLEAVSRISALTHSPPETLGPGSKERKSVLTNLALGLGLDVDLAASKPELGEQLAQALGVHWDDSCWSAGQTITLDGLNTLLGGAERRTDAGRRSVGLFRTPHDEGRSLLAVLGSALPRHLDGRRCVAEMQSSDFSQWAQDEWVGFYFEFVGIPALVNAFGGGPRTIGSTRFDYCLAHTWDLKVHMAATGTAPLNDEASVRKAVSSEGGLGFLVLTGDVEYDEGDFRAWQKDFRSQRGKRARPRVSAPKYKRKSKSAFVPRLIEAFFFPDATALDRAIATGAVTIMNQGRQPSGELRAPKFSLNLVKARMSDELLLAQVVLP